MKLLTGIFLFGILSACTVLKPTSAIEKAMVDASAQRWAGGAPGSGRGVIFTVKFYALPTAFVPDTLVVNNVPLEAALSQVGDTTYVTSSFMAQDGEARTLANDSAYSGSMLIRMEGQKHALNIGEFSLLPQLNYP